MMHPNPKVKAADPAIKERQKDILGATTTFGFIGKLTLKKLKDMEPNKQFMGGFTHIIHPWFNDANNVNEDGTTTLVKYVALRGGIHDWAIYHSMDTNLVGVEGRNYFNGTTHLEATYDRIARAGAKLRDVEKIKELTDCDEEALGMYRF